MPLHSAIKTATRQFFDDSDDDGDVDDDVDDDDDDADADDDGMMGDWGLKGLKPKAKFFHVVVL